MNRAEYLLHLQRERGRVEFQLALAGSEYEISKLGPDRWMKKVWGLTKREAESAWWGCLDCLYGRRTR